MGADGRRIGDCEGGGRNGVRGKLRFVCKLEIQVRSFISNNPCKMLTTAETILTLKNRKLIHFAFLMRVFVEKKTDSGHMT